MNNGAYPRGFGRFFRPPRSESVSISDGKGGLIRDGLLILYQSVSIVSLTSILLLGTLLYVWTYPPWAWWCMITGFYCLWLVLSPIVVGIWFPFENVSLRWQRSVSMVLGAWVIVALATFYLFLWDWAESWTEGFFNFRVPMINSWILAAFFASALFLLSTLFLKVVAKPAAVFSGITFISAVVCWAIAVLTIEWADPGLMYYVTTGGLLIALWIGMAPAAWRLLREISDVYTPYGSESDSEHELEQRKQNLAESKQSLAEEKFVEERAKWAEDQQQLKGGKAQPSTDVQGLRKEGEGLREEEIMEALDKSWEKTIDDGKIDEGELAENMRLEIKKIKQGHHGA